MPRTKRAQKREKREIKIAWWAKRLSRQWGRCGICGETFGSGKRTLDHVIPQSKGGMNHQNVVVAHEHCNNRKGDRMPNGCEIIWLMVANSFPKGGLPPAPKTLIDRRR